MKRKNGQTLVGIVISALFLYLALRGISWKDAASAFVSTNYWYLIPALLVYFLALWVRAYRWTFLMPPGVSLSTRKAFPIFILGCFANNILPLRMGDVYRAYILGKKENISRSSAFASIFVDKVFDALAVFTFLAIAAWILSSRFPSWEKHLLQFASLTLFLGVACLWAVIWNRNTANKLIAKLVPLLPTKYQDTIHHILHRFLDGLETLKNHKLVLLAFFFSIVSWLIEALFYYILAIALGANPPFYASPIVLAVVNLAMMIPASPAGVGTFEYFCVKTSLPFLGSKSLAATYAILVHVAWFLPITVMGLYYLWKENLSLGEFQKSDK